LYWSPTLSIWLDRAGDDVRGHFEERVNPPWWSAANAVEWLLDLMTATGSSEDEARLRALHDLHREPMQRWPLIAAELQRRGQWHAGADDEALRRKQPKGQEHTLFRNEYLDDSGWLGLAWLKMAERTGEARFLATARAIHAHLASHWRPDLGGGVIWCTEPDKQKPNTITNALFLLLSSRLALRTKEPSFREWAEKAVAWLQEKALFDGQGVVDAPGHVGDWWSYNQGLYMTALAACAEATGRPELLAEAARVAESVLSVGRFADADGVIVEKLGTSGWDGALFKGILARSLGQLHAALTLAKQHPATAERIATCLRASAGSLLAHSRGEDGQFTAEWHAAGPNRERNFNTHLSALLALTAALGVSPEAATR
jgi:predicted alpha-1,6-mannanase (GH76 family)